MRLLSLPALALLAACGGADAAPLAVAVVDTLPGGVIRVTNGGPTAWTDTSGWRLVQERVIQPAEGSPGEIGKVQAIVAGPDGSVYIQETGPARIRVYGPDGNWVRDIGREGDGPGEFRDGMFTLAAGVLVVQDPNNTRMTTFGTDGTFLKSSPSQCCWWTSNFPAFSDSTVGILGPPPAAHKDQYGALYLTHVDGRVLDTVLLGARKREDMEKGQWTVTRTVPGGQSMMGVSIPLQPSEPDAYFPDRRRVTGNTAAYTLAITGLRRDTLRLFSAPAPTLSITTAQRDSIFEEKIAGVDTSWRAAMRQIAKPGDIPTTWPAWTRVVVDGASRIWVMRPGPKGANSLFDVFTPEGVLLGSVPVPHDEILEGYWTADHVYLMSEDEAGLPRVIVFRIETKR